MQSLLSKAMTAFYVLARRASALQSMFLLTVRLYWGWQFAQTGWGKLQHLPKVTSFFASLGIPSPAFSATTISWLEFVGGVFFAVGLGSRAWALLLGADMLVAYLTAGRSDLLAIFSNPGKFYGDDAFTFLFASSIILAFGPGRYSVDELLRRKFQPVSASDNTARLAATRRADAY